ncbi:NADH dehydrogenase [ubiquinone] 1 alpha subcomplex assembly factor 2 isoform X4 [Hemicordylus capensis]|uniref:NADH dehydrogenase [ubiquinone] 1 alpha subcomplex assembly factor 2 isoform X4 n=1 Tax=Hemicordylus capensis TaxID=884348 RepID=UPI00230269E4|nr:NADH dehydrogenase [ubiquinone] 1 alpha subcomplex assembly factor 2 isoform X4 [Hemicordylus capensis]
MSGGVWRLIRSLKLRALGPEKQRVGTDYLGNTYYRIPKHKTWAGYPSVQACRLPCYFSPCSSSVYQGANFAAGRRGHLGTIISTAPDMPQGSLSESRLSEGKNKLQKLHPMELTPLPGLASPTSLPPAPSTAVRMITSEVLPSKKALKRKKTPKGNHSQAEKI